MRVQASARVERATLAAARRRAGLPASTPASAVIRYALAALAGADLTTALDCTPGRGSVSHRTRQGTA